MGASEKKYNSGFVLVSILWVTAMLSLLVLGFGRRAALERDAAAYALDHAQAMMMARGAVDRGIVELHNQAALRQVLPEEYHENVHLGASWATSMNLYLQGYFEQAEMFRRDDVSYAITDEDRYININTAPRELIEAIPSLTRGAIRRIMARLARDGDSEEERTPFNTIEELRYIRGVSEDDWFGTSRQPGLRNLLTVWSDDGRINVNTAPREVLECIPGLHSADVDDILNYRAGSDGILNTQDDRGFTSLEHLFAAIEIEEKSDVREALRKYCKTTSSYFRITGVATRRNGRIRAVCTALVSLTEGAPSRILDWQEKTLGS